MKNFIKPAFLSIAILAGNHSLAQDKTNSQQISLQSCKSVGGLLEKDGVCTYIGGNNTKIQALPGQGDCLLLPIENSDQNPRLVNKECNILLPELAKAIQSKTIQSMRRIAP